MILLDSNIIIYSTQNEYASLRDWLKNKTLAISVISKIEVLGYPNITQSEIEQAHYYFSLCKTIPLEDNVISKAIQFRQKKRMSLGDAIIAGTAITQKIPLITANTKDFKHIEQLKLINPLK